MAVPQPNSPLWTAVKAIYDPWPPDLEEVAAQAGDGWRAGSGVLTTGITQLTSAGGVAHAAWQDDPGGTFVGRVGEQVGAMDQLRSQMELTASRCDTYAEQLVSAKTTIVSTIAANEPVYALLGNPLFGPLGPVLRQHLAGSIATHLENVITQMAVALASGAPGDVPQLPAPPAPTPAPEDDSWSWSDLGHTALDVLGLVPVVGEAFDGVNAAWYAAKGDWVNAGLSAAAMIPVAGWLTTGGKLGYKAVTNVDTVKTWLKNRPANVPAIATDVGFKPDAKFSSGLKYQWTHLGKNDPLVPAGATPRTPPRHPVSGAELPRTDAGDAGKKITWEAHGRDPGVEAGRNAAEGPVYRVEVSRHHLDADGYKYTPSQLNKNSDAYSDEAANATHIPYDTRSFPAPDSNPRWMPPNVVALGPNNEEDR